LRKILAIDVHLFRRNGFMDQLAVAAVSGLRSRMESLELLANNLANSGTNGYKSDQEFYSLYSSPDASDSAEDGSAASVPSVGRQWTDFSQGPLQPTGNPFDIALSGRGFLAVNGPGGVLYTRNGGLHVSRTGELVTGEGFPVRSTGGASLVVTSGKPVEIAKDGSVQQDGRTLGKLELVDFKSTESLKKLSGACFQNEDPKNQPAAAQDIQVAQGQTEGSNVAVPELAMRLVGVMRQFEMLQKAVLMGVDMNRKAIEEVAKV
jgi:flagellar basal body rod protein FlgG